MEAMSDNEIEKKVTQIIKQILNLYDLPDNIDWKSDMRRIGFNSISTIQLIVTVEEEFNFEFEDEALSEESLSHFMELKEIVNYIKLKLLIVNTRKGEQNGIMRRLVVSGGQRVFFGDLDSPDSVPLQVIQSIEKIITNNRLWRYQENNDSEVAVLEKEFAQYVGVKYALAVNSCSSAIMLSLICLGLNHGDKVLLPAFTFVAVPSVITNLGAKPILVEIDESYCVDLQDLAKKMQNNSDVKFFLLSHMRGHVSNMTAVMELCKKNNIYVIEDCAHCLGAKYNLQNIGTFGDTGCFSFQSYKIINAGEGGMFITNNDEIYIRALLYSGCFEDNYMFHSIDANNIHLLEQYENKVSMYNFRMSEITAAIVRSQMNLVEKKIERYKINYGLFTSRLKQTNLVEFQSISKATHICNDTIQFRFPSYSIIQIKRLIEILKMEGIPLSYFGENKNVRFYPNWKFIYSKQELANTKKILLTTCELRLPYSLSSEDVELIANIVLEAVRYVDHESSEME